MSFFVISCGGTGGHLSPGIALAEALASRGHESVLLVSQKRVDARLMEKYPQLTFARMPGSGFGWKPATLARCVASQSRAFLFCLHLLRQGRLSDAPAGTGRKRRVDGVFGFGGFTSAPLVMAARALGIPAVLHEANRVPGLAVRTLGRLATRVYLPPGVELPAIRASITRHVGLPVRAEIQKVPAATARREIGLDPNQRVLVVLGGSQGSSPLNDWTRQNLEALAAEGIQVYCVTGLGKGTATEVTLKSASGAPVRSRFEAFSDRMAVLMSAADLVLSRAGAGTIAELIRCEAPAILVPYPQAADDHQRANAVYFEQQGGGLVVPQTRLGDLRAEVLDVITNDWLLRQFRGNLRRMDRANALDLIISDLEEITAGAQAGNPISVVPA
ncbi:UDP-N-acetylglucosamine--N-acetylmuramyl-(pentapeptide) pyrophosphoryl-undecaprenol N-acetylglucosamine transferase [Opitutus sp. ER46]|uniref:UDP-N-acetylglucosamine--N-acetylmuramyl- (pentapeptide) pyrophosphoryl-undecaprenol N-acetylglucosamine transferase n=1 Tax=Opitutus sp. ER46 TaxID=2161864 RepID=UPI000D31ADF5|nr:UDP-N-acetylglucosamine--N-acetylmuramyl-(pentapeptide) pyrophosphoryl-undecaprenol N-acetylglucosamine transferase [Opitutus sp. ER46]PTX90798.1 UDP-N-acetylglucosamine--N-acetylmuramyl-(pentapeptide) pyrophosphoryl-undecaprenol N-acetylglucosamine transferase [Opitutus sp. ER46]